MNQERLTKILLGPHSSEKAENVAEKYRQIVFKVIRDANKHEVKAAVETLLDAKVDDVRLLNVKGKQKRFGQRMGQRKNWKKAYVTLQEGQDIDFAGIE